MIIKSTLKVIEAKQKQLKGVQHGMSEYGFQNKFITIIVSRQLLTTIEAGLVNEGYLENTAEGLESSVNRRYWGGKAN